MSGWYGELPDVSAVVNVTAWESEFRLLEVPCGWIEVSCVVPDFLLFVGCE